MRNGRSSCESSAYELRAESQIEADFCRRYVNDFRQVMSQGESKVEFAANNKSSAKKVMVGPQPPRKAALDQIITCYQMSGGDIQAHVTVLEDKNVTADNLQMYANAFHASFVKNGWTNPDQLCIYTFIGMDAKAVKSIMTTKSSEKRERLNYIIESPVETNRVVSSLIQQQVGHVGRKMIALRGVKNQFSFSSHLHTHTEESTGYLRGLIPTTMP